MGNAIVITILAAIVTAVSVVMVRNKKNKKSSCGCGCASCAMAGSCHGGTKKSSGNGTACVTALTVEGMSCSMCESHINDAVRNNFKVKSVKSFHKNGLVVIKSPMPLNEEKLKEVIEATGYTVKGVNRK